MEYKRVALAMVVVALIVAGSLATLDDKKILSAQYRRYTTLVQQGDRQFSSKNYTEAATTYRQALTINPRDAKLWVKFEQSEREKLMQQIPKTSAAAVQPTLPREIAPQSETVMPTSPPAGGMIIEEDEGC